MCRVDNLIFFYFGLPTMQDGAQQPQSIFNYVIVCLIKCDAKSIALHLKVICYFEKNVFFFVLFQVAALSDYAERGLAQWLAIVPDLSKHFRWWAARGRLGVRKSALARREKAGENADRNCRRASGRSASFELT